MTPNSALRERTQPLTETERVVAGLWKDALQMSELPTATDNFFSLGGDSIAMVMVELQINEEFSVKLPPAAMLGTSSLSELSALIEKHVATPPEAAE